ncbi:DNA cytosine methyltransferase [Frigoribacterium sp. RIT-PI-h]|uniref:DNA cytosine methyltransferase n=1 Tax=Frigoribacterium sp. RIT-PI-h TaxID=1690245 RepID=UPI0006BA048C|nr:DNA cytosine methyltransferase [Frigoribacterium sp. RIT-PI-h]KPG86497.1 hypothetical protein AEQ27_04065 [Frigoribacterium sp. RIT-PI-h]
MIKPIMIDFFCCQGGASRGYYEAGFDVLGIDMDPQPRYPFPFLQMDAIKALKNLNMGIGLTFRGQGREVTVYQEEVAARHGSPPCQAFTNAQKIQGNTHPDLVAPTRELFEETGIPWVIENVPGAPLRDPIMLCGPMFGLETYRHRLFESNIDLTAPEHAAHTVPTTKMGRIPRDGEFMHVVGNFSGVERGREVMGMPWANRDGLREAIPPAYSEYVGRELIAHIKQKVNS